MDKERYEATVAAIRKGTAKQFPLPEYRTPYSVWRELDGKVKAGTISQEEAEQEWHDFLDRHYKVRER